MNKPFTNFITTCVLLLLTSTLVKAQLFDENESYPKVKTIKGKYGGHYWSLDYTDSIGRVTKKESYRKQRLLSRKVIQYDNHNNKVFDIQTYDINNPKRIDTNKYEYKYANNRIIYQFRKLSLYDSTVIKLIKNQGDTLLKYHEQAFYYRPKTEKTDVYETVYTLIYQNGLLIRTEKLDKNQNTIEIRKYWYYDNGRLKRRLIERIPKLEDDAIWVGGPGSDDESYVYKLDSEGRVKKYYKVINGKKFKIAIYKYNKK